MLTFLGIALILFAIVLFFIGSSLRKEDEIVKTGYSEETLKAHPKFLTMWNLKGKIKLILGGLLLILVSYSTLFTKEGHLYYVLSPTGHRQVISSPGVKVVFPFSKIQEWSKYMDIKAVPTDGEGNFIEDTAGLEGIIPNGVKVMFIDRAIGDVYLSARFELPNDEVAFIKIVETYRTPQNLINNTLLPTIYEQLTNITFMYSADDYVSGSATDYKMNVEDGLKNGGFVVKKVEVRDTIYAEQTFLTDSAVLNRPRQIREIRNLIKNEKVLENGIPKRTVHEINANKIITAQVIVSDVILEEKFIEKLSEQRDISVQKIIEIQKIETARAAQQRIVAEGERDKAAERVTQEKSQINTLISIETKVKEEESKRQLADIAVQTANLEAQATKIRADAEAYQNARLVSAGLTPQERAEWDYKTAVGVAGQIKDLKLPSTVITGASGGNSTILEQLLGAEFAKQMIPVKKN